MIPEDNMMTDAEVNSILHSLTSSIPVPTENTPVQVDDLPKGSDNEFDAYLNPQATYHPLAFNDPIEFLYQFDENLSNGVVELHKWQARELLRICSKDKYNKAFPLVENICACNGSGKDAYINATVVLYLTLTQIRHRCIVTSASATQLNSQTESYIRTLAHKINMKLEKDFGIPKALLIRKGRIACSLTGSEIKMFVTDEPGKAEGDHPFPDYPNAGMMVLINEAKSITVDLYNAIRRCNGFNRWIEISSPGAPEGVFYNHCCKAVVYPEPEVPGKRYFRRVPYTECSHISQQEVDTAREELPEALYRSMYLAEFTSLDDLVVIQLEKLNQLIKEPPKQVEEHELVGGLDLSLGGDETVFTWRRGNKQDGFNKMQIKDPVILRHELDKYFTEARFEKGVHPINTDVGGLGLSIYGELCAMGWNLRPYYNHHAPMFNPKVYANLGTEQWFGLNTKVVKKQIILLDDPKTLEQLSRRHYVRPDNDKLKLLSKKDERIKLSASPDRADATVLCFCDYVAPDERSAAPPTVVRMSQEELLREMDKRRFSSGIGSGAMPVPRITQRDLIGGNSRDEYLLDMLRKTLGK
jgi:hypothetical protein